MILKNNIFISRGNFITVFVLIFCCLSCTNHADNKNRIQPYTGNPFYWQYKGKPVLLLGGSDEDNLFNHPRLGGEPLALHLDLLVASGGNYIRNTMSHRDPGNELPFKRLSNGRYNLMQWNDIYWQHFDDFLRMTKERDIIVQIEVWDIHDFFRDDWPERNPWNPQNNTNYSTMNTRLLADYGGSMGRILPDSIKHDFFFSVPSLNNDSILLSYQQRFVNKILSYSLYYSHVVYCISNEIHPYFSKEWGLYWSKYLHDKALKAGKTIEVTEMYWTPDLDHDQHLPSLREHPELFTYFEASQNSGRWQYLKYARGVISGNPRPVNNVKIYGSNVNNFWINIFGGSASARFHRPETGLGLNSHSQAQIKSARLLFSQFNIFNSSPDWNHKLLTQHEENKVFLLYQQGKQYALYFRNGGGTVKLDLSGVPGDWKLSWLDITGSKWAQEEILPGGNQVQITTPDRRHWAAVILPFD